jgi:monoamine oxidase
MLTRRNFIEQAIITPIQAVATAKICNFLPINYKPKVAIIGAGLSGLAAGYFLSQKGIEITILEARSRLGGRVYSHVIDAGENLAVELGAEWIGASHQRVISLCQELELELHNNQFKTHLLYQGKYFRQDEWDFSDAWYDTLKPLLKAYSNLSEADKKKLDRIDLWSYLVNRGITDKDLDFIELIKSTDFGESIRFASAFMALDEYVESQETYHMDYKIKGGNSKLAQALAARIGRDKILLNRQVVAIEQTGRSVTVTCANGDKITADKVICTLPTTVMKSIRWNPVLPEDKLEAIDALQYSRINKYATLYNRRFWQDESFDLITDGPAHYFYHATKDQASHKGALISYTIGDKADIFARQSDAGRNALVESALEPIFGDTEQYALKQVNHYWGNDEFSRGSYAFYGKNQWFNIKPVLQRRFKHVHFAGEHIADWQGYMEGAIETGEAAAAAILG